MKLPGPLQRYVEATAKATLASPDGQAIDFSVPFGEPALTEPESISWQVFKNPVTLMIGGIAAVIMELAEPRVRTGVWEHSGFRQDPARRLRRTGLAAMITVYGPRSLAERTIAMVSRMHARVSGVTPDGRCYRADDSELLTWVHATASYGFLEAYAHYVRDVSVADRDRYYREGLASAALYGAASAPRSQAECAQLLAAMTSALEPSPIVHEFLAIMHKMPLLPLPFRAIQPLLIAAAVDIVPHDIRRASGIGTERRLGFAGRVAIKQAAKTADRLVLAVSPSSQSCVRLGLSPDYLIRRSH